MRAIYMEKLKTMASYIGFLLRFLVCFLYSFKKYINPPPKIAVAAKLPNPIPDGEIYINADILSDIFLRLTVKSVARIRCVSKSWLSVTTDPQFIKAHFKLSRDRIINAPHRIIGPTYCIVNALINTLTGELDPDSYQKMRYCGAFDSETTFPAIHKIIGTCNGLICIHRYPSDIILWNPTTGKFRVLPSSRRCRSFHFGFGYNTRTDDYEVLEIFYNELEVCGSRENSWRRIQDCPSLNDNVIFDGSSGIFANGSLHWIIHYQNKPKTRAIFALNMVTEVGSFVGVGTPCNNYAYGGDAIKNVVLGASLDQLWISYHFEDRLDIWILNEKPESCWSKSVCVKAQGWFYDPMTTKPLHILEDGCAFILYARCGLRIYKPPEFDMRHKYSYLISTKAFIYRESLAIP